MFINPAFAQAATDVATETDSNFLLSMLPLILIFFVFYFMVLRPQNKRIQSHRDMVDELRRGDRIVTGGGLIGTVKKIMDEEVVVEISEGVQVNIIRSTIMTMRKTSVEKDAKKDLKKDSKKETSKKTPKKDDKKPSTKAKTSKDKKKK